MANVNKVMMIGNLTKDPQLSYLPSQTAVAEFGMATNRKWTDKSTGQQREEVCFIDCRCYGRQAETLNKYVNKGDPLYIEGRLQFDTWEKDGAKRSKHRIMVESFQFLGGSKGGGADRPPASPQAAGEPLADNDIPF